MVILGLCTPLCASRIGWLMWALAWEPNDHLSCGFLYSCPLWTRDFAMPYLVREFSDPQTYQKAAGVRYAIHFPCHMPWETSVLLFYASASLVLYKQRQSKWSIRCNWMAAWWWGVTTYNFCWPQYPPALCSTVISSSGSKTWLRFTSIPSLRNPFLSLKFFKQF